LRNQLVFAAVFQACLGHNLRKNSKSKEARAQQSEPNCRIILQQQQPRLISSLLDADADLKKLSTNLSTRGHVCAVRPIVGSSRAYLNRIFQKISSDEYLD
jgi:hypothetical protein